MSPYVVPRRSAGLVGPVLMVTIVGLMLVDARPAHPASDRLVTGPPNHPSEIIRGTVSADGTFIQAASVRLLRGRHHAGHHAAGFEHGNDKPLGGEFVLDIPPYVADADVLYVKSRAAERSGTSELGEETELATALADLRSGFIVVNELTTVASGYSLAQFAKTVHSVA